MESGLIFWSPSSGGSRTEFQQDATIGGLLVEQVSISDRCLRIKIGFSRYHKVTPQKYVISLTY